MRVDGDLEEVSARGGPPRRQDRTRSFVRFEIAIAGGPPWRVDVKGHASMWTTDEARPFVFPDAKAPAWLAARTDALVLAIHRRLDACCR